ncbi:hypothetical protein [Oceanibacterium hippocampi]|nr:hypothetical protein [Oceanibacterium hippocampi]
MRKKSRMPTSAGDISAYHSLVFGAASDTRLFAAVPATPAAASD